MKTLFDKFKETGKKALFLGSLSTAAIGFNGCKTITQTERIYGNPIPKVEQVKGSEKISYYISEVDRKPNRLNIKVNKKHSVDNQIINYNEVVATDIQYEITKKMNKGTLLIGLPLFNSAYACAGVMSLGAIPLYDGFCAISGCFDKSVIKNLCWYPLWDNSYLDPKTKRIIKKKESKERKNEIRKNAPIIKDEPARNVDVRINDSTRKTAAQGGVVYEIENSRPLIIETLAQDGENDRVELK